jgi:hypothetical protein
MQDPNGDFVDRIGEVQKHIAIASWPGSAKDDENLYPEDQEALFKVMQFLVE